MAIVICKWKFKWPTKSCKNYKTSKLSSGISSCQCNAMQPSSCYLASLNTFNYWISNPHHICCSIEFDRDDELFATAGVSRRIKVFEFSSVSVGHFILGVYDRSVVSFKQHSRKEYGKQSSMPFRSVVSFRQLSRKEYGKQSCMPFLLHIFINILKYIGLVDLNFLLSCFCCFLTFYKAIEL